MAYKMVVGLVEKMEAMTVVRWVESMVVVKVATKAVSLATLTVAE